MNNNKKMVTLKDIINSGMIENGTDNIIVSEKYKNGVTAVTTNIISDYLNHEVISISPFSPNAVCVNVKSKKDNDFIPDLTESKNMTIGDLKEAIKYLPDNMKVFIPLYEGTEENIIPVDHCYANIAGIIDDKLYGKGFTFGTLSDASNLTMERIYQASKETVCVEQLFPELNESKRDNSNQSDKCNEITLTPISKETVEDKLDIYLGNTNGNKIDPSQIKMVLDFIDKSIDLYKYVLSSFSIDSIIDNEDKLIDLFSRNFRYLIVSKVVISSKFIEETQKWIDIYTIHVDMTKSESLGAIKNLTVDSMALISGISDQYHFYEDCPNGDAPNKNNLICSLCNDKNKCDKGLDKPEMKKQKPEKTNKAQTINAESDVPEIIAGTPIITNIIGKSVEEAIERIHLTNEKQKIESFEIKLILKRKYNEVDLASYILAYSKIDIDNNIENKVISERFKDLVVDNVSITQEFLGTSYEHTIYGIYINIDESKNTDVVNKNIDVIDQIIRSLTPKQQYHFYEDCPNGDAPNKNNLICSRCDDKDKDK